MKSDKKYLTLRILQENNACEPRFQVLQEKLGANWDWDRPISLMRILELNGISDCLWSFICFDSELSQKLMIIATKTAIFNARAVLHIFEDKFPGDMRPRYAIEAAENWLENPSINNAEIADAAAEAAADAAAEAAADAATAAYAAADAAAEAAADAAAYAAYAAADAAAESAAYAATAADAAADAAAEAAADAAAEAAAYAAAYAAYAAASAASTAEGASSSMMKKCIGYFKVLLLDAGF